MKARFALRMLAKLLADEGIVIDLGISKAARRRAAIKIANVYQARAGRPPYSSWLNAQGYCQRIAKEISPEAKAKAASPQKPKPKAKLVEGEDVRTKEFLSTRAWRALRYKAIREYGARCMCCGASRETGAVINVDHIKPRRLYPELALDINNLQILCGDCNAGKGNWDETDWRPVEKTDDEILDMEALADLRERGLVN